MANRPQTGGFSAKKSKPNPALDDPKHKPEKTNTSVSETEKKEKSSQSS